MSNIYNERKAVLENARHELKQHFIGLDDIIDEIISKISPWYIMPDLVNRPLIVCLWGMTGVGKTDLVRRLVKLISYQDKFAEVQMTIDNTKSSSIESTLSDNENIELGKPYILLLDEIQRFRSVEKDGMENHTNSFKDIWDLLSDGKLTPDVDLNTLFSMLFSFKKYEKIKAGEKKLDEDEEAEDYLDYRFEGDYYGAKRLKRLLQLDKSYEEIIKMKPEEKFKLLMEAVETKKIYEHKDYTKGLIFISGNIDEAYHVANSTDDVDYDADLYHKLTKQINIIDIKKALKKRFKPEQIARFGNNNIIYPSMSRNSFQELISRRINEICNKIESTTGYIVNVSSDINNLIYRNGVFPVQGTRPLFSTINDIMERNILEFIYQAKINGISSKNFTISHSDKNMYATFGPNDDETLVIDYEGDIDKIRKKNSTSLDRKYGIAVHEAGHAVLYSVLLKVAPPQIITLTTNDYANGYVSMHQTSQTFNMLFKVMVILYGGAAAEELVFGSEYRCSGAASDINRATAIAAGIIRKFGMTDVKCEYVTNDDEELGNQNMDETNDPIAKLCNEAYDKAKQYLTENAELFKAIIDNLVNGEGVLTSEEYVKICTDNGYDVKILDSEEAIYDDLTTLYNDWSVNLK